MKQPNINGEPVAVNAKFETLAKYENVSVSCPGQEDSFTKFVLAHSIKVVGVEKVINISDHYSKLNFPVKGVAVVTHFFVPRESMGKKVLANVEVVVKTDYARDAKQTLILNVTFVSETGKPDYRLKIGTDKVPEKDGFQIPGIEKYVAFEKF
jgi:hypothetical protein